MAKRGSRPRFTTRIGPGASSDSQSARTGSESHGGSVVAVDQGGARSGERQEGRRLSAGTRAATVPLGPLPGQFCGKERCEGIRIGDFSVPLEIKVREFLAATLANGLYQLGIAERTEERKTADVRRNSSPMKSNGTDGLIMRSPSDRANRRIRDALDKTVSLGRGFLLDRGSEQTHHEPPAIAPFDAAAVTAAAKPAVSPVVHVDVVE